MSKNKILNKPIFNKYLFIDNIGSGSFGEVYLAVSDKGMNVAAKVEEKQRIPRVSAEYKIYKDIHKKSKQDGIISVDGVPKIYDCYETPSVCIIFMQLLGPSLEDMLNKYNRKLKLESVLTLGEQLMNIMESVHKIGYIHRDIKPNNFLIGLGNSQSQVFITDFGLSGRYVRNGKHIRMNVKKSLIGTARYASINMHNGYEPSRRDDLESIGYMLVYLLIGKLPWQGMKKNGRTKKEYLNMIGNKKKITSLSSLCVGLPMCFAMYIQYCRSIQFDETPNYHYLKSLFINERIKRGLEYGFQWTRNQ